MKTNKYFIYPDFLIKIGVVVILIFAMIAEIEYGFYVLVRCLVTASSIYFAKKTFEKKEKKLFVFFAITAILFNPIFEFSFTRDVWQVVDLFVAFITLLSLDYDYLHLEIKEKFKEKLPVEDPLLLDEEIEIKNVNSVQSTNANPNIFHKIAIINYIAVLVFIFTFFVPHFYTHDINNGRGRDSSYSHSVTSHFYSSIFNSSEIDSIKLSIFIIIPTVVFVFLYKYLETLGRLEFSIYKKKGKLELNILFVFLFIVISTVLFSYCNSIVFDLDFFYNLYLPSEKELIERNIIFVFLASFILLYIIRPFYSILKGMFKEVN
jgi:hypothetical protein